MRVDATAARGRRILGGLARRSGRMNSQLRATIMPYNLGSNDIGQNNEKPSSHPLITCLSGPCLAQNISEIDQIGATHIAEVHQTSGDHGNGSQIRQEGTDHSAKVIQIPGSRTGAARPPSFSKPARKTGLRHEIMDGTDRRP